MLKEAKFLLSVFCHWLSELSWHVCYWYDTCASHVTLHWWIISIVTEQQLPLPPVHSIVQFKLKGPLNCIDVTKDHCSIYWRSCVSWWTMRDSLNSVIHAPESIMHQLMWVSQSKLLMLSKNRVSVTIDNSAIVSMISWLLMPIPLLLTTMTLLRIWEMRLIQNMTNIGEFWEWVETPWICQCLWSVVTSEVLHQLGARKTRSQKLW